MRLVSSMHSCKKHSAKASIVVRIRNNSIRDTLWGVSTFDIPIQPATKLHMHIHLHWVIAHCSTHTEFVAYLQLQNSGVPITCSDNVTQSHFGQYLVWRLICSLLSKAVVSFMTTRRGRESSNSRWDGLEKQAQIFSVADRTLLDLLQTQYDTRNSEYTTGIGKNIARRTVSWVVPCSVLCAWRTRDEDIAIIIPPKHSISSWL